LLEIGEIPSKYITGADRRMVSNSALQHSFQPLRVWCSWNSHI